MRFRFVHAADLHLDTPFEGLAARDARIARLLQDASLEAFDQVVDLALARQAAFVLLAGDIYDGADRDVRAQLRLLAGLRRLEQAGIETFIVHGNHDPVGGWSAIRDWPDGVHVFGAESVASHVVRRDGRDLARVYGISYARPDVSDNLALRFARQEGPGLHVGLLHCNLGSVADHAAYAPCSLDDLRRAGMDYWALGHIHKHCIPQPAQPCVVYPGNTQGRSPKPSECGPKGAVVVEADESGVRRVEFAPVDRTRFVPLTVDISAAADVGQLRQLLLDAAASAAADNAGRALLLRGVLVGSGELHADLARSEVVRSLLMALQDEQGEDDPPRYWEGLRDQTQPELNLDAIRGRGDLLDEVLRLSDELSGDPERLRAFLAEHLGAMERLPGPLRQSAPPAGAAPPGELELLGDGELLERARLLALERLAQGGRA